MALVVVEQPPGIAGQVGGVEGHELVEPRDVTGEDGLEQLVLVPEVRVDQRLVAAGGGGHAVDPGAGDAVLGELGGGGVEQPQSGGVRVPGHVTQHTN
jgi:hypothetical protein